MYDKPQPKRSDPMAHLSELADQSLKDLQDALLSRHELTVRFLREIEKEISEAMRMLGMLGDPWKHGEKTEYEFMRISLDKALTARKKDRRQELLKAWRDELELKEKRLGLLKELATVERR